MLWWAPATLCNPCQMCQASLPDEAEAVATRALSWALLGGQVVGRLLRDVSRDPSWDVSWRSSPTCLVDASSSSICSWIPLYVSGTRLCIFPVQVLCTWASRWQTWGRLMPPKWCANVRLGPWQAHVGMLPWSIVIMMILQRWGIPRFPCWSSPSQQNWVHAREPLG
jgi:hypothetical protein